VTRYLDVEDVMQVLDRVGLRGVGVRDGGLLVSALARPRAQLNGVDVYPSLALKAAALLTSLATSSSLASDNLRVAWVLTRLFCAGNGAPLIAPDDDAVTTVREVVSGSLTLPDLASRLGLWMTPVITP
jgi:death-on-curing protein